MYKFLKIASALIILILISSNIYLFLRGVNLSNEIHIFENKISKLEKENDRFESEIYKIQSHTQSASIAAELNFGKFNAPIYGTSKKYALK